MNVFKQRRADLLAKIERDAAVVISAAPEAYRSKDVEYPYRQNSDFYYFTGFEEPHAVMVLLPGSTGGEFALFCRSRDPDAEAWTGPRAGLEGAKNHFNADIAYDIKDFAEKIQSLLKGRQKIYSTNKEISGLTLSDLTPISAEMRLIKSDYELVRLQRAIDISAAAHCRAMRSVEIGMMEYELEAEILHEFTRRGSRAPAYGSIVGGGANACVLHYVANNKPLNAGELVLVDAGAEYEYYAADITRTYPINGKFSPEQALIYNLVLRAQLAVIEKIRPGLLWTDMQNTVVQIFTQGLVDLKILTGDVNALIAQQKYKTFYMHGSGHWLGMDVHDVGAYKINDQARELKPGMVFTVEPGLYIKANNDIDKKWWNIGVRIEDDVLVTKNGCKVLSYGVPKTIEEIENLMAKKSCMLNLT